MIGFLSKFDHIKKLMKSLRKILFLLTLTSIIIPGTLIVSYLIYTGKHSIEFTLKSTIGLVFTLYYVVLILTLVSVLIYWLISRLKKIWTLRNEKNKTEILLLKSEVNPHFFFNMLNNLYAMIDTETKLAKDLVLKLSDLMRYSIYEGRREFVKLQDEIDFINNYINLHKIRYHRKLNVDFDVNIKDQNLKITPLLFIILVENSFKHGIEKLLVDGFIKINLEASENKIVFEIENNFKPNEENKNGIGLANLKRRLELLYSEKSKLETRITNNVYYSKLEIRLT